MPSAESYRDNKGRLRWRGRYRGADGRKSSRTFDTKSAAMRWAASEEDKVARGVQSNPTAARLRWGDWCDRWLPSRTVEPSTRRTDESVARNHVRPRWGTVPLIAIGRVDIQAWINQLSAHLSASRTRHSYYLLSSSLESAVAEGILASSPCVGIRLPTPPTGQERFLSDAEAARILYYLDNRWRVLTELLLGTGLRLGEATGLHAARVDLDNLRISTIETYDAVGGAMSGYPKSKRRRTVPLTPELGELLQAWLDREPPLDDCGKPHRGGRCPGGLLLRGDKGSAIDGHNFYNRQWKRACGLAGLDGVRIHDLRHTYASQLVQRGISLEVVQKLLGHESFATTQRYAHLSPEDGWDGVRAALSEPAAVGARLRAV